MPALSSNFVIKTMGITMRKKNHLNTEKRTPQKQIIDCNAWISEHGKLSQKLRNEWEIGSKCQVYSVSKSKWCSAEVMSIFHDNEGEWLVVKLMMLVHVPTDVNARIYCKISGRLWFLVKAGTKI